MSAVPSRKRSTTTPAPAPIHGSRRAGTGLSAEARKILRLRVAVALNDLGSVTSEEVVEAVPALLDALEEAEKQVEALRTALRGLVTNPVVSGLSAAIRDNCEHQGVPDALAEARAALAAADAAPEARAIPMLLYCPNCHVQHIDVDDETGKWATTRLHHKHYCKPSDGGCGQVWEPAKVDTVGVRSLEAHTEGQVQPR